MLNRILYWFGLAGAAVMVVFTIFLIWERINQIEAIRGGFWDNLAYSTSQADFELIRLIDTLSQSTRAEAGASEDDIFVRFEVALGRLVGMTEGRTGQRILSKQEVRETILSSLASLELMEADVLAFSQLSPDSQQEVLTALRSISAEFHRATVTIASLGDQDQTDFYNSLANAARFEILMLALIVVAGAIAFANVIVERRRFAQLNLNLSETVSLRTAELKANNTRLQEEVMERSQAEQRFRSLVDHATEAIVIVDADTGYFVEANPRAEALFGLPRNEIIGKHGPSDLSPELQPDGRPSQNAAMSLIGEALRGDFPSFEWIHQSIDGTEVPCQVTLARFPDPKRNLVRGSLVDLTEKKNSEASKRDLENQLIQAQKLETIGQLTGGVAHDFNNLLSVVLGNLEFLKDDIDDTDARKSIQAAIDASMRGAGLTRSMLNFARQANLKPEAFSLHQIEPDIDNWIARTLPSNIQIQKSFKPDLWSVTADFAGTQSALLNLIVNARDAMPDGGVLVIETENLEIVEVHESDQPEGLAPGYYVMLAVSDTGTGIAADLMDKVYDPFFSTKGPANNSGLGLSMVHGFMKQSGGSVRIYSEVGVGTTVKLLFPATDVSSQEMPSSADTNEKPFVAARILVAEDEPEVLRLLQRALEGKGHEVLTAENGDTAAELFETAGNIDLLITDIVMPGKLQGTALAKKLRTVAPNLPVVFMSGYASEATRHGNGLQKEDQRLMKPVARKDLLKAVDAALCPDPADAIEG